MSEQVTNNGLAKFITVELVGTLLFGAFAAGGIWFSVDASLANVAKKVAVVEKEQDMLDKKLEDLSRDMMLVKNDQSHIKEQLNEQKDDIKQILKILRYRN